MKILFDNVISGWSRVTEAHSEERESPGGDVNPKRGASVSAGNSNLSSRYCARGKASKLGALDVEVGFGLLAVHSLNNKGATTSDEEDVLRGERIP